MASSAGNSFLFGCAVSVFGDQQHFAFIDGSGVIWDSWYDGSTNSWNLQQINAGGMTDGPKAGPFWLSISVFGDQQHFVFTDLGGVIWDCWYDGSTNSWNVNDVIWDAWYDGPTGNWQYQQINAGGLTNGPSGYQPFVSVFGDQQHVAYLVR